MSLRLHQLALGDPPLPALARWFLDEHAGLAPEERARAVVVLPSSRAATELRHALLEASGAAALLLPMVTTPRHLADWLGDVEPEALPHESLRPLLLAPALARAAWLADRPDAAPGFAEDLVALFDEVRWARCTDLVLEGRDDGRLLGLTTPEAADLLAEDLARVREGWALYREVLPRDQVDARLRALAAGARGWPGPLPTALVAAHLGAVPRAVGDFLLDLARAGVPAHLVTIDAGDARSRRLLATYREAGAASHPLAGPRRLAAWLAGADLAEPAFAAPTVAGRAADLAPDDGLALWSCRDPEHESRVVAARVCAALEERAREIVVATPDRGLAARIVAQLRDAGVDVDDTRGRALAALPAGRLLRDLLRVAVTGGRFAPLFEVLTHPYASVARSARPGHAVLTRLLEGAVRRSGQARGGLGALRDVARAWDDDMRGRPGRRLPEGTLAAFVDDVAASLAPLTGLAGRRVALAEVTAAVRAVWGRLAPGRPLAAAGESDREIDDVAALAELLEALDGAAPRLPARRFDTVAADVARLLTSPAWERRPHRARDLPVRVMGLVEARLERADLVILAGLGQDVFPGRLPRPSLLDDRVRRGLGLPHWRERVARDGELLLRLLHAAPEVTVTWPGELPGRPALPSPFVQRLELTTPSSAAPAALDRDWRRAAPDLAAIDAAQRAFVEEPDATVAPPTRLPEMLSHASLSELRTCAYRYLLGRVLQLRRADDLEPAYGRLAYGQLAHEAMRRFLHPHGAGWAALAAGDATAALAELRRLIDDEAGRGLPQARLWGASFALLAPRIVAWEIERARAWRPALLEAEFELSFDQLASWLQVPLPPELPRVPIKGRIDRVDVARGGEPEAAVIDFKTGRPPSAKDVQEGAELQVALYAIALEAGAVTGLMPPPGGGAWRVAHGGYYGLRPDDVGLDRAPQLPPGDAGRQTLARAGGILLDLAVASVDPAATFPLVRRADLPARGRDLPCERCELRAVCRLEERESDPEVAARLVAFLTGDWRRLR